MGLPLNANTTPPKPAEPYPRFPKDPYWDDLLMKFHTTNILVQGEDPHHPFPFTYTDPVLHKYIYHVSIPPGSTEARAVPTSQIEITTYNEPIPLEKKFVMTLISKMKEFVFKRIDRSGLFENLLENDFRYLEHWIQMAVRRHVKLRTLNAERIRRGMSARGPNTNHMQWPTRLKGTWGEWLLDRRMLMRDAGRVDEAMALSLEPSTDDEDSDSDSDSYSETQFYVREGL